ncbi:uncharacterized protein LOC109829024 [Asparagus officinalis]|uniref:uncharacterized protein LOC109829024 n=1 Tax=Asparagus officinalis TaxID=4686 RepID=UPI00098E5720|nr:uncharacterized protein LOC109829024 [Asparagus officinalis]
MAKLIRGWKSALKNRYFTKISTDWKRIYELDKRVYPFNWMTLIIEWEGEKKKICETASVNRKMKIYDHFLGSTPYARIEHKYLSENPDALTMPPALLARRAYTPPQGYENVEGNDKKVEKINELVAAVEASQNEVLTRVSQSQGTEDTPIEPNRMTRDEWMEVVDGAYGLQPRKKGRVPLSSVVAKKFTTTNKPSSQSLSSHY